MSADLLARGLAAQARTAATANAKAVALAASAATPPTTLGSFTVMASPPTITVTDVQATSTIASAQAFPANSAAMKPTGTPLVYDAATFSFTSSDGAGTADASKYFALEFMSDAAQIGFQLIDFNAKFDLFVDDQPVRSAVFSLSSSGQTNETKLDWSADGFPRKPRHYRISGFNMKIGNVYTDASAALWYPAERAGRKLIAVLGDSYTQSTGAASAARTFAGAMAARLGMDLYADGIGGTGWTSTGGSLPTTRIAKGIAKLTRAPDYIVTALGYNDKSTTQSVIDAAAASYDASIAALKAAWPNAKIITIGPWTPQTPQADINAIRTMLVAHAAGAGVPFVDLGNTNASAFINANNYAIYDFGDHVHPNPAGHQYLGWRVANAMKALL